MKEQSYHWSRAADRYEQEFVDPYQLATRNPVLDYLARIEGKGRVAADLGCGIGPLLPRLARQFERVHAVDFASGMLKRARERCLGLSNIQFHERTLTDLAPLLGQVDVVVAINSLVQPTVAEIETVLAQVRLILRPGGQFLGIVPAMDAVHYHTMLLVDRARRTGMPEEAARANAAQHAEHALFDFAFAEFTYQGLRQHFWQPFEIPYRLKRAGFSRIRIKKVLLSWSQFAAGAELHKEKPVWDWGFLCKRG
jgi:SAM-dependent methyltransferase